MRGKVGNGGDALVRAARLVQIISLVFTSSNSGRRLIRREIAERCGCDVRTVGRDLDLLREIAPIQWDRSKGSYVLTDRRWRFPVEPLIAEDILALTLARGLLSASGVPQREALRRTFDRILKGLPPFLSAIVAEAGQTVAFPQLPRDYSDAPVAELTRAISAHRTVEIDYESRNTNGKRGWRRVDPYQIAPRAGIYWELHGWCPRNVGVRTFALDRIYAVRLLNDTFTRREAEWQRFLQKQAEAVGGIIGNGIGGNDASSLFVVNVLFDSTVAAYVSDRRWPSTLQVEDAPDGTVRLSGTTPNCKSMVVELLRWRRFARVAGGPELREAYCAELQAMVAANDGGSDR